MPQKYTVEPNLDEIEEGLGRSGYFMESRIISSLTEAGFFVEPSPPILDSRTGKSRELDLVAEFYDNENALRHKGVAVKTYFVVEAVNNRFPFVLLTQHPQSPLSNSDDYAKRGVTPIDDNPFLSDSSVCRLLWNRDPEFGTLFCQYAELTRKNGRDELMASHGDGTYQSLLKLSEFIENEVRLFEKFQADSDPYWRIFFWRPVLILAGQLVKAVQNGSEKPSLHFSEFGQLAFNWHDSERPRTTIIDIVTERFYLKHFQSIASQDAALKEVLGSLKFQEISQK
jgi:hypothetical protein